MEVDDDETTDPDLVRSILAPSILGSGTEEEFFKLEREEGDGDVRGFIADAFALEGGGKAPPET